MVDRTMLSLRTVPPPNPGRIAMKAPIEFAGFTFVLTLLAGCASSEVTQRESLAANERLARPDRIIVYDVAATADDVQGRSDLAGRYSQHATAQTPEEIETGRRLGALLAQALVTEIRNMGLPAVRAAGQPAPRPGDILISGQFVSEEQGSRGGKSNLKTTLVYLSYLVFHVPHAAPATCYLTPLSLPTAI